MAYGGRLSLYSYVGSKAYESDTSVSTLLNGTEGQLRGLGYAAGDETYGNISLASSDSYGPSPKCVKAAM